MAKNVGLWIDRKRAVIVTFGDRLHTVTTVESGVRHSEYRGAPRSKSPYSAQYSQGDDQLDRQFLHHLDKYYKRVVTRLRGAEQVLVFGPGEAKSDLKKYLAGDKSRSRHIVVESADKMTDRQIVARVRRQFEQPAAKRPPRAHRTRSKS
jgi:stalled ribosome rescue protein Dom34